MTKGELSSFKRHLVPGDQKYEHEDDCSTKLCQVFLLFSP